MHYMCNNLKWEKGQIKLIKIDVTKPLHNEELYFLHELDCNGNGIIYLCKMYFSKEIVKKAVQQIVELAEKMDFCVDVKGVCLNEQC